MRFKENFLKNYLNEATIPLAYERAFECEILSSQEYLRPMLKNARKLFHAMGR